MSEDNVLPSGWAWVQLDELLSRIEAGKSFKCDERPPQSDEVGIVKVSAVTWGEFDEEESKTVTEPGRFDPQLLVAPGDFLFSRANTIELVGACVIAKQVSKRVMLSDKILRLRFVGIPPEWILWALRSRQGRDEIEQLATGNQESMRNISQENIRRIQIPLAPFPEQQRIVAAIEQQFTRLDAGVAALKSAQTRLKRYRAAVLKAAVEGKLTETWRAEHPTAEPASVLLQRILAERRAKWEADLRAKGKDPVKVRYEVPAAPAATDLPKLPERWCWATVEQLGDTNEQAVLTGPFGSNLGREDFIDSGVPVLTIGCLTNQGLSLDKAFYVSEVKASELERYRVKAGDMLFSRMASVGRAEMVSEKFEGALINYHLMRLRLTDQAINPHYFVSYVRGSGTVSDYVREVNHGATRDGINTSQLLNLPISLPPRAEQEQIVAEVERRLSVVSELEATVEANLKRAELLRQSILREAFAGRLVPQDPNDEPASVLLERIRREREGNGRVTKKEKEREAVLIEAGPVEQVKAEQTSLWDE